MSRKTVKPITKNDKNKEILKDNKREDGREISEFRNICKNIN
jgi:exosome complex RNA-binding protein Rrp42 (RNase PH superfamily)